MAVATASAAAATGPSSSPLLHQMPVTMTNEAVTVPATESLALLDALLVLSVHQHLPLLTDRETIEQSSHMVYNLNCGLQAWRDKAYNPDDPWTMAVTGLLAHKTYSDRATWGLVRKLFSCQSNFQAAGFVTLYTVSVSSLISINRLH